MDNELPQNHSLKGSLFSLMMCNATYCQMSFPSILGSLSYVPLTQSYPCINATQPWFKTARTVFQLILFHNFLGLLILILEFVLLQHSEKIRHRLITLTANSLTQGWEASALVDQQRGSLCALMARQQPLPSLNSGPSQSCGAGTLHTLAGARCEARTEQGSVGPAAAALLCICDRFLSSSHNCLGIRMKWQLPKAAGPSWAALRCFTTHICLIWEESIWEVQRERFFLAMASEDAFGFPEVKRRAAQQKKR